MKKIAAHYWLRPDGSVGKFPVITLDDAHRIVEIRERDVFREEASLRLVNGFLVPGLVDYCAPSISFEDSLAVKKYINRLIIRGVKTLGVPNALSNLLHSVSAGHIAIVKVDEMVDCESSMMGFEKIQEASDSMAQLMQLTLGNAKAMGVDHLVGSLEPGKIPGLMAISNLDYKTFDITHKSKLKIIF